jgi:hypothetical protein
MVMVTAVRAARFSAIGSGMDKRGGAEVDLDGLNTKARSDSFVERQQALDEFLDKSAKNKLLEYDPADFVEFFKALYSPKSPDERFRHKYASIFKILEDNSVSQAGNQPPGVVADGVVDYLSSVKDAIPDDAEGKAAKQGLFKLIDHINLESQRMTSSYNRSDSLGNSVTAIAERAETINEQIGSLEQKQEELKKKQEELASNAQNAQRDNVAILGIFAAIVIAFATGTGFAVSSMQVALRARDLFALGFIVSLVGLVLLVVRGRGVGLRAQGLQLDRVRRRQHVRPLLHQQEGTDEGNVFPHADAECPTNARRCPAELGAML